MKIIFFGFLFTLLTLNFIFAQTATEAETMYPTYKNRVSINLLGLTSANLVTSYERAFKQQAIWIGFNYHLNGFLKEEDRQMTSIAAEYRYYLFSKTTHKFSDGLFLGLYSKYRRGEETKQILPSQNIDYSHRYNAIFAGLNLGYRYNYKRLALSTFAGYGLPLYLSETNNSTISGSSGETIELNEGFKNDLRLGITLGIAF
ncbi:hypothetical protein WAF17_08265 [Bernardetia sp. ABR2-2B]|uniref:hypothetical protein n=1 Tax=Bernardetia sp. ABR2-2B TaxID=3127472 RepID=UPI0030D35428